MVRGLAAIDPRLAIACAAGLAALFVAIELHGTWVEMPAAYANTTDTALQWRRLTPIHPAILSGRLRWWFLATQLGALCLAAGGTAVARARAPSNGRRCGAAVVAAHRRTGLLTSSARIVQASQTPPATAARNSSIAKPG